MIQVRNLVKRFGTKEALRGISFDIRRGEVLGLLGHNGAGKTTTLRVICTILQSTGGSVELCDPEIPLLPDNRGFKARLGYFPDDPFLFDYLTGREMLYFIATLYQVPRDELDPRVRYYLQLMELNGQADQVMKTYSRGMRRKISLIGSVLHEPLYWFLDEPTEALDPVAIRNLKQMISRLRSERRAIILSTHQLPLAEALCDRLVILNHGRIVFDGTLPELQDRVEGRASLEDIYVQLVRGERCEVRSRECEAGG